MQRSKLKLKDKKNAIVFELHVREQSFNISDAAIAA